MAKKECDKSTLCVNCHCDLNVGSKESAVHVADDSGVGSGKIELWCPQCFVWHRAAMEPERFHYQTLSATSCYNCGIISVDFGRGCCSQCSATRPLILPPKLTV